ncbi:Imm26 family immunity protein [Chryseobacterium sp. Leaf394]|uniref:Imm26 family immunity protein n=1 Tax=Chryseobacterium sp. Leaf394 TaxID=1736361 RepID=UPI0006F53820|nr:Imm26 family immunity protein [Chryseobacterium sp. Leaf394]KQS92061.1 hypothetical protein ASG21_06295 [Chryseobacterium sp. Leaf394]
MSKNIKVGDIFAIKIEQSELYYFGRVVFDVQAQYDNSGQDNNYLDWHKDSVLVETYKHISDSLDIEKFETAIISQFIPKKELLKQDIKIVKNLEVDPTKVSFPETLKNHQNNSLFTVGELSLKTNFSTDYAYDNIKVFPTLGKAYYLELATLDFSGRRDLIVDQNDILDNYFKFSDLRSLPEKRIEVYQSIGENPNLSYYDLALKHGFDLQRFY